MMSVALELERYTAADGAPHVLGSISVAGGAPTKFVGWLALLALLEKSIVETTPSESVPDSSSPPAQISDWRERGNS